MYFATDGFGETWPTDQVQTVIDAALNKLIDAGPISLPVPLAAPTTTLAATATTLAATGTTAPKRIVAKGTFAADPTSWTPGDPLPNGYSTLKGETPRDGDLVGTELWVDAFSPADPAV